MSYLIPLLILAASGCSAHVSFSVSSGKIEPATEATYRNVWQQNVTLIEPVIRDLSVCNAGGVRQACYAASEHMISVVNEFRTELTATKTPSRYARADADLKAALIALTDGYEQRNRGISSGQDGDFIAGNDALKRGNALWEQAYGEFPPDARPSPAL
jgi:hypothetical protein